MVTKKVILRLGNALVSVKQYYGNPSTSDGTTHTPTHINVTPTGKKISCVRSLMVGFFAAFPLFFSISNHQ